MSRRKTFDEIVQHVLGLTVHPVQVLEHQEEWLNSTLSEQETLQRLERPFATLPRVEYLPLRVVARNGKQGM